MDTQGIISAFPMIATATDEHREEREPLRDRFFRDSEYLAGKGKLDGTHKAVLQLQVSMWVFAAVPQEAYDRARSHLDTLLAEVRHEESPEARIAVLQERIRGVEKERALGFYDMDSERDRANYQARIDRLGKQIEMIRREAQN